jgi:acetyl-CoA synthetase
MSLSGGEAALIADRCAEHGIDLPECSTEFGTYIKSNFAYAMASNPFDPSGEITGRPEKLRLAIRGFVELNGFTEVLFATPVLRDEQARRQLAEIGAFQEPPHPDVCYSYWPAGPLTAEQGRILRGTAAPTFEGSSAAVRAIALHRRANARRRHFEIAPAGGARRGSLDRGAAYADVRTELAALDIEFPPVRLARSAAEARAGADELGYPVVLKANVTSSVHKQANGLVELDVRGPGDVEPAFARVWQAGERFEARGIVVEARGRGQLEVIVGATRDPIFGPTVVFGSGGSTVEYLHDAAVVVARYLDASEATAAVLSTRVGAFLAERSAAAVQAAASTLVAVAGWFIANDQIASLDLNPLLVDLGTGRLVCVDARVA